MRHTHLLAQSTLGFAGRSLPCGFSHELSQVAMLPASSLSSLQRVPVPKGKPQGDADADAGYSDFAFQPSHTGPDFTVVYGRGALGIDLHTVYRILINARQRIDGWYCAVHRAL